MIDLESFQLATLEVLICILSFLLIPLPDQIFTFGEPQKQV